MAIEDAYVTAAYLKKYFDDPSAALTRYEDIRRERTSAVVRESHANRRQAFQSGAGEAVFLWRRNGADARARGAWLYTYATTAIQI